MGWDEIVDILKGDVKDLKGYINELSKRSEGIVFEGYKKYSHSKLREHLHEETEIGKYIVERTLYFIEQVGPEIWEEIISL